MNNPNKPIEEMLMEFYDKGFADCEAYAKKSIALAVQHAVLLEREACAKLCDDWKYARDDIYEVAKVIRARNKND